MRLDYRTVRCSPRFRAWRRTRSFRKSSLRIFPVQIVRRGWQLRNGNTVEHHLSGLIGTAFHPDMQRFRIIGFFFENKLHWQFAVRMFLFTVCTYCSTLTLRPWKSLNKLWRCLEVWRCGADVHCKLYYMLALSKTCTRWFKYDRDWFVYKQAALRSSCATLREWSHNLHPPSCSVRTCSVLSGSC